MKIESILMFEFAVGCFEAQMEILCVAVRLICFVAKLFEKGPTLIHR